MMNPAPDARQAATVIIFRERSCESPELLVMERSAGMAFAAGALVFPGGAVDAGDSLLAERFAPDLPREEGAARVAAIRETLEESGVAIGFDAVPDAEMRARMRDEMVAGAAFAQVMADAGLGLDLGLLIPFARWHPNAMERTRRVYDTRFYLTRLAGEAQEASADTTENIHLFWASASDILDRCDRGEGRIIFPTRRNLERLSRFADFDTTMAHALETRIGKVTPWIEDRDDGRICVYQTIWAMRLPPNDSRPPSAVD